MGLAVRRIESGRIDDEKIAKLAERLISEGKLTEKLKVAKEIVANGADGWRAVFVACGKDEKTASAMRLVLPSLIEAGGAAGALYEVLQEEMQNPSPSVRRTAVAAAGKLLEAARGRKAGVRENSLRKIIAGAVNDADEGVAHEALVAVKKNEIGEAAKNAAALISDAKNDGLCKAAAATLAAIGTGEQLDALHNMLEDANPKNRELAAVAIGAIADPSSLAPLRNAMEKEGAALDAMHAEVSLMAATIFSGLGPNDKDRARVEQLAMGFCDAIGTEELRDRTNRKAQAIMSGKERGVDSEGYNDKILALLPHEEAYSAMEEAHADIEDKLRKMKILKNRPEE